MSGYTTDALPSGRSGPGDLEARAASRLRDLQTWGGTTLQQRWRSRVVEAPPNDFIIAVSASSKTGVSGSGKTTLATQIAKACAVNESGFDADEHATLDAGELAYQMLPNAEFQAPLIYDEAQGAPGTDSVNKRRGMKQEALDAINGILAARDDAHTLIIVIQQLSMLDKSLLPLLDAWLMIRYEPAHPNGPMAVHYEPYVDDHDTSGSQVYTKGVEKITWGQLPKSDPDYQRMEELKQEAKRRKKQEAEEQDAGFSKEEQMRVAQALRNKGMTVREVAELDVIEYSRSTVARHTQSPDSEDS